MFHLAISPDRQADILVVGLFGLKELKDFAYNKYHKGLKRSLDEIALVLKQQNDIESRLSRIEAVQLDLSKMSQEIDQTLNKPL